jgi:hypothetical protein
MTTVKQLVLDALPRIAKAPPTGTTFYQAINYVASMIAKRLIKVKSDLLVQMENTWTVTPDTVYYDLPDGFISLAEKPYNPDYSGSYDDDNWDSDNSQSYGGYDYDLYGRSGCLEPITGSRARFQGQTALSPYKYELLGLTQIVFYPALDPSLVSVSILARYYGMPSIIDSPTQTVENVTSDVPIPFNGLFDQAFFQGVPRVITKGLNVIQADPDFEAMLQNEVDTVLNARAVPLPRRRMKRGDFY